MSTDLTEKQRRELDRLRIAKELDRREREKSNHTRKWIVAVSTLVTGAAAVITLIVSRSPADSPPPAALPQVIVNNSNGSNNGNVTNSHNGGNVSNHAGRDIVNGNNTSNLSVDLPKPAAATTKVKEVSDYKKYIDSNVHRMAGTTNVAIALRGLPGFPPGALESAVQRALRERGFRIVPIFRNQFREDEAELRLFNGDASFAHRLKLHDHCDSVLVGVLRFGGPAQVVDGGLYIREAVLEIHAVDPSTGLVIDSLEISEKGGGATAELSAINAVSRLKESVIANISGWSWV